MGSEEATTFLDLFDIRVHRAAVRGVILRGDAPERILLLDLHDNDMFLSAGQRRVAGILMM